MKIATPPSSPEKSHLPLSQQPPLKVEVLSSPPFLKIWLEAQSPQQKGRRGAHYVYWNADADADANADAEMPMPRFPNDLNSTTIKDRGDFQSYFKNRLYLSLRT